MVNFLVDYPLVKSWDIPCLSIHSGIRDKRLAEHSSDFFFIPDVSFVSVIDLIMDSIDVRILTQ